MIGQRLASVSQIGSAAIANAAATAVLGVISARFLGPEGQGSLTLITTVVALVALICAVGTGTSLRIRADPVPSAGDIRAYLGLAICVMPITGGITAAALLLLKPGLFSAENLVLSLLFGALCLGARQIAELVQAFGYTSASILSLAAASAVQAVVFGGFVSTGHASVNTALLAGCVGAIAQAMFGLRRVWRHLAAPLALVEIARWLEMVRQGYPTLGYTVGVLAMQRTDRLLLVAIAGPRAGGMYAVAATVAEAARITSSAVGQLLFVRTSTARAVTSETRRIYELAAGVQVCALITIEVFAPSIVAVLFGSEYRDSVPLLRGLLVAELFMGLALMDSRILMGLSRLRLIGTATIGVVVASVPTYWALINLGGAGGAVVASIIIYAGYAGTLFWVRTHDRGPAVTGDVHV